MKALVRFLLLRLCFRSRAALQGYVGEASSAPSTEEYAGTPAADGQLEVRCLDYTLGTTTAPRVRFFVGHVPGVFSFKLFFSSG